jgi:alpha-L-fucosidase
MIEIELDPAKPFDRVVLAEPTWLGQRVKKWRISVPAQPSNNHRAWTVLAEGTTIGHKRIVRVPETAAKHLRIEILDARACPCLSGVSVHRSVNIAAQR